MRETKAEQSARFYRRMEQLGFSYDEATSLRRIEMTLSRWGELECGDGNNHGSWAIERDEETEKPFMVRHHYGHGQFKDSMTKSPIADREKGALKRLEKIMAAHPDLWAYHQSDPRGCMLYIGRKDEMNGSDISANYTRGVAVCV